MKSTLKMVPVNRLRHAADNYRSQFNYGDVNKLGEGIKQTGISLIQPLRAIVNKSDKDLLDVFSGTRRLAGILALPSEETKDWNVPVQVFSELSEVDRITLMVIDNDQVKPSLWETANAVERLTKQGLKSKAIAERINVDDMDVVNCKLLYLAPIPIREAGEQGRIAATTYLARLRDAKKHKKQDEFHAELIKALESQEFTMDDESETEVKRIKFDFPSYDEREKARQEEIATKQASEQYAKCYDAVDAAIKGLGLTDETLSKLYKDEFAKLIVPSDSANEKYAGMNAKQRFDSAKEFCQGILSDLAKAKTESDKKQQEQAELQKQAAGQSAVANSTTVQPTGESPAISSENAQHGTAQSVLVGDNKPADITAPPTPPVDPVTPPTDTKSETTTTTETSTNDSATKQGQGETEASRRKARVQALVGLINSASDTTSLTKDAKSRLGDAVKRLNDIQKWSLELVGLTE